MKPSAALDDFTTWKDDRREQIEYEDQAVKANAKAVFKAAFNRRWAQGLQDPGSQDGFPARSLIRSGLEKLVELHVAQTPLKSNKSLMTIVSGKLHDLQSADDKVSLCFLCRVLDAISSL